MVVVLGAQLLDREVKCSSRFCRVGGRAVFVIFEKVAIEPIRDFRTIVVINRPVRVDEKEPRNAWRETETDHLVATTLRNPENSIVPARCMASSGSSTVPFAVSHALRKAKEAFGRDCAMIVETFN